MATYVHKKINDSEAMELKLRIMHGLDIVPMHFMFKQLGYSRTTLEGYIYGREGRQARATRERLVEIRKYTNRFLHPEIQRKIRFASTCDDFLAKFTDVSISNERFKASYNNIPESAYQNIDVL